MASLHKCSVQRAKGQHAKINLPSVTSRCIQQTCINVYRCRARQRCKIHLHMHMHMYVYICIYTHTPHMHTYTYMYIRRYTRAHIYIYVDMLWHLFVYMAISVNWGSFLWRSYNKSPLFGVYIGSSRIYTRTHAHVPICMHKPVPAAKLQSPGSQKGFHNCAA